jgi:hypothetical protein
MFIANIQIEMDAANQAEVEEVLTEGLGLIEDSVSVTDIQYEITEEK